ncbi:MAG: rhomboid family intramembrane serine protease [Bacteroidia bacterium]|nr:rhomboid family intramembrane serine protease [Bacteroidia bacterium]
MFRSITNDIRMQLRSPSALIRIIIANVAVFLLLNLLLRIVLLLAGFSGGEINSWQHRIENWLALPYDPALLLTRPWTLFTSLFIHGGLTHILFNMLNLYWFGSIFSEFTKKRFSIVYFGGGLVSAALAWTMYQLFPQWYGIAAFMIGASGAVMAIVAAAATLVPDYSVNLIFIGPVRIKYLALFMILFDLLAVTQFSNTGGHIAHLGGAFFGYLYIRSIKNGWNLKLPKKKLKVVHRRSAGESVSKRDAQKRIDDILDKINRSGYDSLTKEEKEDWFKYSNKI